jgi:hypothetical protein
MFCHIRRIAMDVLDVEMSITEGEQALQALLQLFDLDLAESVLMAVAKEAPADYESFYAQRPLP